MWTVWFLAMLRPSHLSTALIRPVPLPLTMEEASDDTADELADQYDFLHLFDHLKPWGSLLYGVPDRIHWNELLQFL